MRTLAKIVSVVVAVLVTGTALEAQGAARGPRPMRPMLRRVMADTARRQAMRQRLQSLSPEQKAAMKERLSAGRAERQQLAQGLRSGQLTRAQARAQMREWQRAHRKQNPRVGAQRPLRP